MHMLNFDMMKPSILVNWLDIPGILTNPAFQLHWDPRVCAPCQSNFSRHRSERIIIGVCGIPASGKTTLAIAVAERINQLRRTRVHAHHLHTEPGNNDTNSPDIAICVSQDGWHLPRSALDQFDDVELAYNRRGAAFTFDGTAFSAFVLALRVPR